MDWFVQLLTQESMAHILIVVGIVVGLGLLIGQVKIFNIGLGIAGVLFSGLLISYLGFTIQNTEILQFMREFGLILFVYSIGLQVGPSFLNALYAQGLRLNLMAAAIVLLGVAITVGIHFVAQIPMPVAVGLLTGGTTNTPSLAAAQQALLAMPGAPAGIDNLHATGYAIAYPFGIIGIIISMLVIQFLFRMNPKKEAEAFAHEQAGVCDLPEFEDLDVINPNLDGVALKEIHFLNEPGVLVTRIKKADQIYMAHPDSIIQCNDTLRVVGPREKIKDLHLLIGQSSQHNLREDTQAVVTRTVLVSKRFYPRKTIDQLQKMHQVVISRVHRAADVEFVPSNWLKVQYADQLTVVGPSENIQQLSDFLGDSKATLNHPDVLPIFMGIVLGVILGSVPFYLPGTTAPIKLGLAGGPLLVAIVLSARGSIGPFSWHLPKSANLVLREVGIVLFLAAVGLSAGGKFFHSLAHGDGFYWMALAVLITLIPLMIVGVIARWVFKVNFMTLCGLLSGSMTDPPALAFANTIANSSAPSIAYATVYPLVMILRIITAQLLVQLLCGPGDFLM